MTVWQLPQPLRALRPDAAARLDHINEWLWGGPDAAVLELIRLRIAWLLGNAAGCQARNPSVHLPEQKIGDLPAYATSSRFSPFERAGVAFAEQFVMDVAATTQEARDDLGDHLGHDRLREFVSCVYLVEFTQRLQMMAWAVLPSIAEDSPPSSPAPQAVSLREMLADYQDAVVRGAALDPVVTELVRLRCARTHHCRICQTLRLADAHSAGVDEGMTSKIDYYETSDLPEAYKVALRITDAFILRPDAATEHLVRAARATFPAEQLAELCLDITKWSTQKIHVALGTDTADALPINEAGVALFGFHDDGRVAGYWADPDDGPVADPRRATS